MTKEAGEFLEDYASKLHLELCEGLEFTKGISTSLSLKQYLEAISPFIYQISMRQNNKLHYLPFHVMIYFIIRKLSPFLAVETGVDN